MPRSFADAIFKIADANHRGCPGADAQSIAAELILWNPVYAEEVRTFCRELARELAAPDAVLDEVAEILARASHPTGRDRDD